VVANKWLGDLLLAIDYVVIVSWSSAAMVLILLSAYMSRNLRMGKAIVFSRKEKLQYMLIVFILNAIVIFIFFISFPYERRGLHIYLVDSRSWIEYFREWKVRVVHSHVLDIAISEDLHGNIR